MSVRLTVNRQIHQVDAPSEMPLLWVLRDLLQLRGTKFGCGVGQCGACTVHLDGDAARSCQVTLGAIGARQVTTIEGLSPTGDHPVQRAWAAEDVSQCGYCQPGFLMAAAALLQREPNPTDASLDAAFAGHLCRCGTYPRIRLAVHRAALVSR